MFLSSKNSSDMKKFLLLLIGISLVTCQSSTAPAVDESNTEEVDEATKLIRESISAHGGSAYSDVQVAFDFRDRSYTLEEKGGAFKYTSQFEKDGDKYFDVLTNESFSRTVNGEKVELADSNVTKYSNSLNSVIYFAMLPEKLEDPATIKYDRGVTDIKGQTYHAVEIHFQEEGGGTDFDDTFYYWINSKTNFVDYLAYNYQVDGGGVRFRSAYNPQVVAGIRFQDYVNYKAEIGTPLADLPDLFVAGKLKELSKIELENMKTL